jgi:8-oxo-dGTP pyrophosphatase MutT (NUDIX family)
LADRLREALALGASRSPVLLPGDLPLPPADMGAPDIAAAVLIAIVDRPDPGLILTLRTDSVRRHAGQVAFPGGRIDPGDDGPIAAALREAEEEIGLPPHEVEVVGTVDRYRTVTGYQITPVVGVVPPDLRFTPQPSEVAAIFEAPLAFLLDERRQQLRTAEWQGSARTYFEIEWEDRRIWGATAAMLVNFGRRLAWPS